MFTSALLVAAIYSSFAFVQFASSMLDGCAFTPDLKRAICIGARSDKIYIINCTVDSINEWYCDTYYLTRQSSLPGGLKDAIDKAGLGKVLANTTSDNDTKFFDRFNDRAMNELSIDSNDNNGTKVPNDFDLNKGGLLKDDGTTGSNNDTKVPKDLGGLNDDDNGPTTNPED